MTTTSELNRAVSCANDGVRFGAYNRRVMTATALETAASTTAAMAAKVVA
ncbi:hypothetical protein [Streptomyces sp. NPDC090026]